MLKLKAIVLFSIMLLVLPLSLVNLASASTGFSINVDNPIDNSVISTDSLTVDFSVVFSGQVILFVDSMPVCAYLDDKLCYQGNMGLDDINNYMVNRAPTAFGSFGLTDITQGRHTLEIQVEVVGSSFPGGSFDENVTSATVDFVCNCGVPPEVSILGLDEYAANQVFFNITTSEPISYCSYSIDGQVNTTLPYMCCNQYNVTLNNLSNGDHSVTAYSKDTFGNTGMAKKTFTVKTQNSQPTVQFQPLAVIVGVIFAAITLVCTALLLFTRNRKPKRLSKTEAPYLKKLR
jgi:hypothetical protein